MLNRLSYGSPASPLIVRQIEGSTEGKNPQQLTSAELAAAGHTSQPILEIIRAKCPDCSGGSRAEAARCTAVKGALWPYRNGLNPFGKARGNGMRFPAKLAAFPAANGLPEAVEGGRS